ncbi:MAG: hypothetical protein HQL33_10005 [Alphaproteobacteria bacterium]|nr:hypothetical protein [Alphaproteobacteria bacterium]MBF0130317.1 hypothetical protein [Alphaproteobacteria bacterium]
MKYFERLSVDERKRIILSAVAFSSAMEGMSDSRDRCLEELRALDREKTTDILTTPTDQEGQ